MARVQQKICPDSKDSNANNIFWVKGRTRKKEFATIHAEGILSSYLAAPFGAVVLLRQSQDA